MSRDVVRCQVGQNFFQIYRTFVKGEKGDARGCLRLTKLPETLPKKISLSNIPEWAIKKARNDINIITNLPCRCQNQWRFWTGCLSPSPWERRWEYSPLPGCSLNPVSSVPRKTEGCSSTALNSENTVSFKLQERIHENEHPLIKCPSMIKMYLLSTAKFM